MKGGLYMNKNPKESIIHEYGLTQDEWNEVIERYKWHLVEEGYFILKLPMVPTFISKLIKEYKSKDLSITFYDFITKISAIGYKDIHDNNHTNERDFVTWLSVGHEEALMVEWLKISKEMNL